MGIATARKLRWSKVLSGMSCVACPEATAHSSVQGGFIPTISVGIPGGATIALILRAMMIQEGVPGPRWRQ